MQVSKLGVANLIEEQSLPPLPRPQSRVWTICHWGLLCGSLTKLPLSGLVFQRADFAGAHVAGGFFGAGGGGGDAGASTCLSPAGKLSCDWVMSSPQRSEVGGHQVVGGFTHHGLCVFEEPEDRMSVWASPSCCQEAVLGLGDHASQRSVGFHFS